MTKKDRQILRDLARRKLEIAHDPVNVERREAWYNLDADTAPRPMVLAEISGISDARKPVDDAGLQCEENAARGIERGLRREIYEFGELQDDHVVEPWIQVGHAVSVSNYGVEVVRHRKPDDAGHGSYKIDPPIRDLDKDFDEEAIRKDLRTTLNAASNCRLEIIMKDVHTLNNEPERLARWVAIAREEIAR